MMYYFQSKPLTNFPGTNASLVRERSVARSLQSRCLLHPSTSWTNESQVPSSLVGDPFEMGPQRSANLFVDKQLGAANRSRSPTVLLFLLSTQYARSGFTASRIKTKDERQLFPKIGNVPWLLPPRDNNHMEIQLFGHC